MTLKYDADELIESVRNRAMCPDSNSSGSRDQDIIRYLNEEMATRFFPALCQIREEYNVYTERTELVASQTRYRISARAGFNRIRDVMLLNSSGVRQRLAKVPRERLGRFPQSPNDNPVGYYLEWDHLVLVPDTGSSPSGSLEISYFFRPPEIVATDEVTTIAGVDTTTGIITLDSAPTAFTDSIAYDIHGPKSGSEIRAYSITALVYNSGVPSLTFTATDIDGSGYGRYVPQVGDYVCLEGECAIPFLPRDMHPMLAHGAAVRLLRAAGDHESADRSKQELDEFLQAAIVMTDDRIDGEPDTALNPDSFLGRWGSWGTDRRGFM